MKAETNGVATAEPAPKAKRARVEQSEILIPELNIAFAGMRLVGDSPLICNRFSEKAKEQMREKQMKKAKTAKKAKDPHQCFLGSLYPLPEGGHGFPAIAFKAAAVDACSHVDGVTKVQARGAFHINCELVKIDGTPTMREDMVRVGMGTADIRYRGEFKAWACEFQVRFNADVLSFAQIVNLFNVAGFAIGVGEWRPQRDGSYGMFHVA